MAVLFNTLRELARLPLGPVVEQPITLGFSKGIRVYANPRVPVFEGHATPDFRWQQVDQPVLRGDGSIAPFDANQGTPPVPGRAQLGTCWLTAPIQADLRHAASLVEETDSAFLVHFPEESVGVRKELLTLDGDLAFTGRNVFPGSRQTVAPAVIEKALAAREGTYNALHGGSAAWALERLHGVRADRVSWHDASPADVAAAGHASRGPVLLGTTPYPEMSTGVEALMRARNIGASHYYSLDPLRTDAANGVFQLVNPRMAAHQQPRPLSADELNAIVTDVNTLGVSLDGSAAGASAHRTRYAERIGLDPTVPDRSDDPLFH